MKTRMHVLAAAAAAVLLSACGSSVKLADTPVESRSLTAKDAGAGAAGTAAAGAGGSSANTAGASETKVASVDLSRTQADDGGPVAGRIVYFDFDSFVVKDEFRPVVETNAKRLNADRKKQVVVEGHTDDRGSTEYNLALGQRRAEAVARALALLGVKETQVEAVSYGEERPASPGGGEDVWAKNRRAELRDR